MSENKELEVVEEPEKELQEAEEEEEMKAIDNEEEEPKAIEMAVLVDGEEGGAKEPGKTWVILNLLAAVVASLFFVAAFVLWVICQAGVLNTKEITDLTFRTPDFYAALTNLITAINGATAPYVPFEALLCALAGGFLALTLMFILTANVLRKPVGIDQRNGVTMYKISQDIHQGAVTFLRWEGIILAVFCAVVSLVLVAIYAILYAFEINKANTRITWVTIIATPICFLIGAATSGITAVIGMCIATKANVRTANACRPKKTGLSDGLKVAFDGGSVMGMSVVGLGIASLVGTFMIFRDLKALAGFGFGASTIALFARVGGGIFTKAADVGADLVGKYEQNIPEDDPRNPATIADNVGDNVGDVAGMGSDLFESYVGSIIAAATLGGELFSVPGVALPFYLSAGGILCSFIGSLFVTRGFIRFFNFPKDGILPFLSIQSQLLWAIRKGIFIGAGLNAIVGSGIILAVFWNAIFPTGVSLVICYLTGLLAGVLIGYATELFTSNEIGFIGKIANAGVTGPATVIIKGLYVGMLSAVPPVIFIGAAILTCMYFGDWAGTAFLNTFNIATTSFGNAGVYGVSIASVGMLSTLGVTLATDAYGPIADNAGGLAEMSLDEEIDGHVRDNTDALDALGNTTAATGKGFAIGSAVLTSLALMSAFTNSAGIASSGINLLDQRVLFGVLIGALLPFAFSALTMDAVNSGAESIIKEVRHQFRTKRILEGIDKPDHEKCVAMCTRASLLYMIPPGVIAVLAPIVLGAAAGPRAVAGLLGGAISTGFLLAVTLSNAGGAWDNSKKHVEQIKRLAKKKLAEARENGDAQEITEAERELEEITQQHKATVVGDTVGDPFKDTSGPSLNILIKLMSIVSLVIAPLFKLAGENVSYYN